MKIKFAMATNDAYQCVLETFLKAGWQLDTLFVSPENWMHSNRMVIARALELSATVKSSAITVHDLADLGQNGCTTLVVASCKWKIPDWRPYLKHAVNFHPSPLPEGRGPYTQIRAILEDRPGWAVTCHQINEKFDQGDILDAEHFQMTPEECHETLQLKVLMAATRLAERVATGFESLWAAARPQGPGSYWPRWSDAQRVIDFNQPIHIIMRQVRAFGDLECTATINGVSIFIHRAHGWTEPHLARPGAVVHSGQLSMVVAAANGFIAITEWSFTAPGATASKLRR